MFRRPIPLFASLVLAVIFCGAFFLSCQNVSGGGAIVQKSSDWLFVLYMDGDSNLNDEIWENMIQAELALADLRNEDGSAKEGRPTVNIVMLWDGASEEALKKYNETRLHPEAALYELGAMDEETKAKIKSDNSWLISRNAVDLTSAAPWLPAEPNMASVNTLTNFLRWTRERYAAKHVVLSLGDHGLGTENETLSGGAGAMRSLCSDDTNGDSLMLSAIDIRNAISNSGLRPNILWMDCCLQGNVETAYMLRGMADYLVTSANTSYSHDYEDALKTLTADSTPESFGRELVKEYAETQSGRNMEISDANNNRASYDVMLTNQQISLNASKQNALYSAIGALAQKLLDQGDDVVKAVYDNYIVQTPTNVDTCKGMAFPGTYTFLNDIGYFCYDLIDFDAVVMQDEETIAAAKEVVSRLDDVVVTAWYGKFDDTDKIFYKKNLDDLDAAAEIADGQRAFGLTIAASPNDPDDEFEAFDLAFNFGYAKITGYNENWGTLVTKWNMPALSGE